MCYNKLYKINSKLHLDSTKWQLEIAKTDINAC